MEFSVNGWSGLSGGKDIAFDLAGGEAYTGDMELNQWFRVTFDEAGGRRKVSPPGREAWSDEFAWADVIRVCFKAGDFLEPDELYIFTNQRPESYVIPTEADGGLELLDELIRRKLFDAKLSIEAATSTGELFCWPEE